MSAAYKKVIQTMMTTDICNDDILNDIIINNPSAYLKAVERINTKKEERRVFEAMRISDIDRSLINTLKSNSRIPKVDAIKVYRERTGAGLKESKAYVEQLMEKHNIVLTPY